MAGSLPASGACTWAVFSTHPAASPDPWTSSGEEAGPLASLPGLLHSMVNASSSVNFKQKYNYTCCENVQQRLRARFRKPSPQRVRQKILWTAGERQRWGIRHRCLHVSHKIQNPIPMGTVLVCNPLLMRRTDSLWEGTTLHVDEVQVRELWLEGHQGRCRAASPAGRRTLCKAVRNQPMASWTPRDCQPRLHLVP